MSRSKVNEKLFTGSLMVGSFAVPEVRAKLGPVGLTEAEIQRGIALLAEARRLQKSYRQHIAYAPAVTALCAWERRRFPLVRAVLDEVDPALMDSTFEGIEISSKGKRLYSIGLVCERILAIADSDEPALRAGWDAIARHFVTRSEIAEALEKATQCVRIGIVIESGATAPMAERDRAVAALVIFRKKWARIARIEIKDRRILRAMGAVGSQRSPAVEDPPVAADAPLDRGAGHPQSVIS